MRMHKVFLAALGVLLMASSAQATVITGNNNWNYYQDLPIPSWLQIGDGTNHVTYSWGLGIAPTSGYFYGSDYLEDSYADSEVAFATGVTNISQIADASILALLMGDWSIFGCFFRSGRSW